MGIAFAWVGFLATIFTSGTVDNMLVIERGDEARFIGKEIYFLVDSTNQLDFSKILLDENQEIFFKGDRAHTNFPASSSIYWVRLTIENKSQQEILMRIGNGWIGEVDFYRPLENEGYGIIKTGYFRAFENREYPSNYFVFKLFEEGDSSTKTFYVRLNGFSYPLDAPFLVGTTKQMQLEQQKSDWLMALYVGALIIMICYNFIIFITIKDHAYLYYILYLISLLFVLPTTNGAYSSFWLWRDYPGIDFFYFAFSGFIPLFMTLFAQSLLKLRLKKSRLLQSAYILLIIILGFSTFNLVTGVTGNYNWWTPMLVSLTLMFASAHYLTFLVMMFVSFRNGSRQAGYLFVGWSIFILSIWVVMGALQYEMFPASFLTKNAFIFGSFIEITLFSMALTDRMNVLKEEKEIAQKLALKRALENEQMIQKQNDILERKVAKRTFELEELVREKDGLVGVVAHDLASPLSGIQGFAGLALKEVGGSSDLKTYVNKINDLSISGKQLIQDLLTVSKANNSVSKADITEINIKTFLEEILEPFSIPAKGKKIDLVMQINVDNDTSLTSEHISVRRIIENLVSNAIKFSPIGGTVKVGVEIENELLKLTIKDSGPGFTKEDKGKMFKKFQRLSAKPTNKENSTGLGLSIVKALCERIQSKIEVDTILNEGTTFTMTFKNLSLTQ